MPTIAQPTAPRLGVAEYLWLGVGALFMVGLAGLLYVNRPRGSAR